MVWDVHNPLLRCLVTYPSRARRFVSSLEEEFKGPVILYTYIWKDALSSKRFPFYTIMKMFMYCFTKQPTEYVVLTSKCFQMISDRGADDGLC